MSAIVCPQCEKDDQIQKVSSVVSSNQNSNIAKRLAPPPKPEKGGFSILGWITLIFFFLLPGYACAGNGLKMLATNQGGLLGGIAVLALGALALSIFVLAIKKHRHDTREYPKYEEIWKTGMSRWNKLYYCIRNDIVFNPETGESFQHVDMEDFMFRDLEWDPDRSVATSGLFGAIFTAIGVLVAGVMAVAVADLEASREKSRIRSAVDDELNKRGY